MHEASLMMGLMHRIAEIAAAERAQRVTRITVWLGAMSHFSAEHFAEHFERVSRGTAAEGARLEVKVSSDVRDVRAQEVVIESVEVET